MGSDSRQVIAALPQRVYLWRADGYQGDLIERCSGAVVEIFGSEEDMLKAWHAFFMAYDPDAVAVYEVRSAHGCCNTRGCFLANVSAGMPCCSVVWCLVLPCACVMQPEGLSSTRLVHCLAEPVPRPAVWLSVGCSGPALLGARHHLACLGHIATDSLTFPCHVYNHDLQVHSWVCTVRATTQLLQAGAGLASLAARWKALKLGGPAGELRVSRLAGTRGPALAVRRITMCMPPS